MYIVDGVQINDEFLLCVYSFYNDIKKGIYDIHSNMTKREKDTLTANFLYKMRSAFLMIDQYDRIGKNIVKFATQTYSDEERLHVFSEFSRGCSLVYFGDMELINKAIFKLENEIG